MVTTWVFADFCPVKRAPKVLQEIRDMKSKRQSQVGELIRRAFSTVLQAEGPYIYGHDKLVTITSVDVTPDFAIAKVYLSIFNADDKDEVMGLMQQSTSMLRSKLAQRISKKVRRLPDLHFFLDETVDEMYRVNQLLDGLKKKEE